MVDQEEVDIVISQKLDRMHKVFWHEVEEGLGLLSSGFRDNILLVG